MNRYLYASSNPINVSDPTGHDDLEEETAIYTEIDEKNEEVAKQFGLQVGWLDAVNTAVLLAEFARLLTNGAMKMLQKENSAQAAIVADNPGRAGVGLGLYEDTVVGIGRIAADNDVGVFNQKGLVDESVKAANEEFYLILDSLVTYADFDLIHDPKYELSQKDAGGRHEEKWLVMFLEKQNFLNFIPEDTFPVIGVSQDTICGTCLDNVFGAPQKGRVRNTLPYTGCVLDAAKNIDVAASGVKGSGDLIRPQDPLQDCVLLLVA